ncbi:unnamed protein product [Soboliphyme baturini]|uniref:CENP-C_C domain-containing protein n=1 Tax=Soboliphyme baturini TaxID=241478 RepID=A0A183IKG4_9BILA|nr:unnamed protein product [Soboliphyme baturini]
MLKTEPIRPSFSLKRDPATSSEMQAEVIEKTGTLNGLTVAITAKQNKVDYSMTNDGTKLYICLFMFAGILCGIVFVFSSVPAGKFHTDEKNGAVFEEPDEFVKAAAMDDAEDGDEEWTLVLNHSTADEKDTEVDEESATVPPPQVVANSQQRSESDLDFSVPKTDTKNHDFLDEEELRLQSLQSRSKRKLADTVIAKSKDARRDRRSVQQLPSTAEGACDDDRQEETEDVHEVRFPQVSLRSSKRPQQETAVRKTTPQQEEKALTAADHDNAKEVSEQPHVQQATQKAARWKTAAKPSVKNEGSPKKRELSQGTENKKHVTQEQETGEMASNSQKWNRKSTNHNQNHKNGKPESKDGSASFKSREPKTKFHDRSQNVRKQQNLRSDAATGSFHPESSKELNLTRVACAPEFMDETDKCLESSQAPEIHKVRERQRGRNAQRETDRFPDNKQGKIKLSKQKNQRRELVTDAEDLNTLAVANEHITFASQAMNVSTLSGAETQLKVPVRTIRRTGQKKLGQQRASKSPSTRVTAMVSNVLSNLSHLWEDDVDITCAVDRKIQLELEAAEKLLLEVFTCCYSVHNITSFPVNRTTISVVCL